VLYGLSDFQGRNTPFGTSRMFSKSTAQARFWLASARADLSEQKQKQPTTTQNNQHNTEIQKTQNTTEQNTNIQRPNTKANIKQQLNVKTCRHNADDNTTAKHTATDAEHGSKLGTLRCQPALSQYLGIARVPTEAVKTSGDVEGGRESLGLTLAHRKTNESHEGNRPRRQPGT
jgi:hypothetical protein